MFPNSSSAGLWVEQEMTLENGGASMYTHERNKQGKKSNVTTLNHDSDYCNAAEGVA